MIKKVRLACVLTYHYIKANWKLFFLGLAIGIGSLYVLPQFLIITKIPTFGLAGDYTVATLPLSLQNEISFGLTKVLPNSQIAPAAAKSWEFADGNKTVIFNLDTSLKWQNGDKFNSESINYNLKGVQLSRPSEDKIKLTLKEPFAPLLSIVSQPLFKSGLVGLGRWRVQTINFNGRFISSLELTDSQSKDKKIYKFFPTSDALLMGLKLGSVQKIQDLNDLRNFNPDEHFKIDESYDSNLVVTLFFNLEKDTLEDKSFRQGLAYSLPDDFTQGIPADAPIPKKSWVESALIKTYPQNLDTAKKLVAKTASGSGSIKLILNTIRPLEPVAKIVVDSWKKIGIDSEIVIVDVPDPTYDVFLTYVDLPQDPDQYFLWHSTQIGNLSHYKSPKVDKLLEDGRKTLDQKTRKEIYGNFLKAITEDLPAIFLFYPKTYAITRV